MGKEIRKTGVDIIGDVRWGTHFCQFYQTKEDLIDILAPYFKAGLENNEFCMWVTSEPLKVGEVKLTLGKAIKNLDYYIRSSQIEILDYTEWYTKTGVFEVDKVLQGWIDKENGALKRGFDGLRLTGNTFCLEKKDWQKFADYEEKVNSVIGDHRMLAICTYSLDKCGASEVIDVVKNHQFALIRRKGRWELIESTERKRAAEALWESEERYSALMNLGGSVGEAIVMLQDRDGVDAIQIFVSNEWPRITGYSRKELLNMSFFDLLHPKHREASLKRHQRRMSGEIIPGLFEMSIIGKDGTEVPIEVTSAYTTYKGERANVAFIRDITERKQAEEREERLQQELNISSRLASIGELAAGVAHEINNPLTGILAFSERLLRKSTDEEISRDLERIYEEASRVARVVQNLLTFARRRESKKEYLDINEILGMALELRAYELKTSNIEVATDLAPDLPRAMVDSQQVQQVFLNIILNAEQAMTEANNGGKLTIKTQPTKGYIRGLFTDDGPGIPAEQLDRVFDPFFTTREERGGTGLGLSLCHGIVTEHGGRIYVRSKPGKGATFFVELPLVSDRQMRLDEANIGLNDKQAVAPDWR